MKKKDVSALFDNQKRRKLCRHIEQHCSIFEGTYLYPSIEEQAVHLLYFVIKKSPIHGWNKRIGEFLFVWFLEKNKHGLNAL